MEVVRYIQPWVYSEVSRRYQGKLSGYLYFLAEEGHVKIMDYLNSHPDIVRIIDSPQFKPVVEEQYVWPIQTLVRKTPSYLW